MLTKCWKVASAIYTAFRVLKVVYRYGPIVWEAFLSLLQTFLRGWYIFVEIAEAIVKLIASM